MAQREVPGRRGATADVVAEPPRRGSLPTGVQFLGDAVCRQHHDKPSFDGTLKGAPVGQRTSEAEAGGFVRELAVGDREALISPLVGGERDAVAKLREQEPSTVDDREYTGRRAVAGGVGVNAQLPLQMNEAEEEVDGSAAKTSPPSNGGHRGVAGRTRAESRARTTPEAVRDDQDGGVAPLVRAPGILVWHARGAMA